MENLKIKKSLKKVAMTTHLDDDKKIIYNLSTECVVLSKEIETLQEEIFNLKKINQTQKIAFENLFNEKELVYQQYKDQLNLNEAQLHELKKLDLLVDYFHTKYELCPFIDNSNMENLYFIGK